MSTKLLTGMENCFTGLKMTVTLLSNCKSTKRRAGPSFGRDCYTKQPKSPERGRAPREGGAGVWKSTVGVKVRKIGESPLRRVIVHGGSGSPRLGDAPNSTPPLPLLKKCTGEKRGPKMTKIDQNRPKITKIDQIWPPTKSPREGPGPFREVFRGQKRPSSGSTVPDMAHPRPL